MTFPKMLGGRVLIRPIEEDKTTASGLVLADTASLDKGILRGTVVATGRGAVIDGKRVPMTVRPGDIVHYPRYGGVEFGHEGEDLVILNESDILAYVCTKDTDGDGDCHECHKLGGCENRLT